MKLQRLAKNYLHDGASFVLFGKTYNNTDCMLLWTDGVNISLTATCPCYLGVYWGTAIADMYPIIHRPWSEIQDITSTSAMMSNISLHHEDFHMFPFCIFMCDFMQFVWG